MALQMENFGDLLQVTQNELGEPNFTNLMSDLRGFPATKILMQRNKMKVQSGPQIEFRVLVDHNHQAANVAITDADSSGSRDGMIVGKVPWRKTKTSYGIYKEEALTNRQPRRIVDLTLERRAQAQTAWVELMEQNFWNFPVATDTRTPYGLPYWCTKNATEGFHGGTPSGYSLVANIDPATYTRFQNYSGQYVTVEKDDMIRMARLMAKKSEFKPAVDNLPTFDKGRSLLYATNTSVEMDIEDYLDSRNENLGDDVAKNYSNGKLRRADIMAIPQLDNDTTNPFYQIDFGVFSMTVLAGAWNTETVYSPYPGQRNLAVTFIDYVYQFICRDRRKLGVLATGTTYP